MVLAAGPLSFALAAALERGRRAAHCGGGVGVAAGHVEVLADLGEAAQEVAGGRHSGAGGPGVGGDVVDVEGSGGVAAAGIGAAGDEDLVVERAGGGPVGAGGMGAPAVQVLEAMSYIWTVVVGVPFRPPMA